MINTSKTSTCLLPQAFQEYLLDKLRFWHIRVHAQCILPVFPRPPKLKIRQMVGKPRNEPKEDSYFPHCYDVARGSKWWFYWGPTMVPTCSKTSFFRENIASLRISDFREKDCGHKGCNQASQNVIFINFEFPEYQVGLGEYQVGPQQCPHLYFLIVGYIYIPCDVSYNLADYWV